MKAQDCRLGGQYIARERGAFIDEPKSPKQRAMKEPEKQKESATWRPFLQFFTAQPTS